MKGARPVRTGGRRKRTCATGTSPAAYRCCYLAEAAGLEVWLVNARDVKHLPGRSKSDRLDCVWLCKLNEWGMLRRSFVPPEPVRDLRALTRLRANLTHDRVRHQNRIEKILEDAQLTELRERIVVSGGSAGARAARFPARDQRKGWRAGSVVAEGAALRGG